MYILILEINAEILFSKNRIRNELVDKKSKSCGNNINLAKFINCLKEDFIEKLNKTTFRCLSFYEHNIMKKNYPNFPVCNASKSYQSYEFFISKIIDGYAKNEKNLKCYSPCVIDEVTYNSAFAKSTGRHRTKYRILP